MDANVIADFGCSFTAKLKKRLFFKPIIRYIQENRPDYLYLRAFHNANPITIHFLKEVRKAGTKIVIEIPTYPYDGEYRGFWQNLLLLNDKIFRKSLAKNAEYIVTFSQDDTILGRPTIKLSNGIDLNKIPLRKLPERHPDELHLLGVAEIHFWHGFDRLINGLKQYYKNGEQETKVFFHIVGTPFNETEKNTLKKAEKGISQYVIHHGALFGDELNAAFDKCDICIGSLGRHRSGVYSMNSLKNREYAARGFAFIYSENDPDFDNEPFVLKVPADESPVDIQAIVDFSKQKFDPAAIRKKTEHLSWNTQMLKVLNVISKD